MNWVVLIATSAVPRYSEQDSYKNSFGQQKRQAKPTWLEDYEYVIIGSGPGGGPLAARLAIAGFKVLLIDAGSDQGITVQESAPTLWVASTQYAPMQWNYFVNHFPTADRQLQDTKFTWQTPSGDYFVGPNPPN